MSFVATADALGSSVAPPIPLTYALGNVLGGVVFGVGMALSGFCPGTVAAGAGEGRLDYVIPGGLGLYAGALVYGFGYERIMPVLAKTARAVTIPQLLHVEPWLMVVVFTEIVVLAFYTIDRSWRWPRRTPVAK